MIPDHAKPTRTMRLALLLAVSLGLVAPGCQKKDGDKDSAGDWQRAGQKAKEALQDAGAALKRDFQDLQTKADAAFKEAEEAARNASDEAGKKAAEAKKKAAEGLQKAADELKRKWEDLRKKQGEATDK